MFLQTEFRLDGHGERERAAFDGLGEPDLEGLSISVTEAKLPLPENGRVSANLLHIACPAPGLVHRERRDLTAAL